MQEIAEALGMKCFNTSHVVVYLLQVVLDAASDLCFNTSHVVVYPVPVYLHPFCQNRFNTSHVVVYPFLSLVGVYPLLFQYISCCSLSKKLA